MKPKPFTKITMLFLPLALLLAFLIPAAQLQVSAQGEIPTDTPPPSQPDAYRRPLIVLQSYSTGLEAISPGQDFNLSILLVNSGQRSAQNVVATFVSGDLVPRDTGGVIAVGTVHPNNRADLYQPLTASRDLWGKSLIALDMLLTYTDENGISYNEKFLLTFGVNLPQAAGPTATPSPTPTATGVPDVRPQLVISGYEIDPEVIQPGSKFNLSLSVQNVGNADAKRVTMIVGGGSSSAPGPLETPGPYGTFGASGEFTNFAPLGASNIQLIGDIARGARLEAGQPMIVNVSTNPGAYSMKVSFTYADQAGHHFADEQVISLLVYSVPNLEVSFYMEPPPMMAGQPNMLPLQVVNLGKKSAVLGNMRVTAEGAEVSNNTVLVGTLEMGGYFPLDAMLFPQQAGPLDLIVTLDYTDDFNQPQQITRVIPVFVEEAPVFEPFPGEESGFFPEPTPPQVETFWQKVVRFLRGLIGLDSGQQTPQSPGDFPGEFPMEEPGEFPVEPPVEVPVVPRG
jgi:hypothetical protein